MGEESSHPGLRTLARQPSTHPAEPPARNLGPFSPLAEGFLLTSRPSVAGMGDAGRGGI